MKKIPLYIHFGPRSGPTGVNTDLSLATNALHQHLSDVYRGLPQPPRERLLDYLASDVLPAATLFDLRRAF